MDDYGLPSPTFVSLTYEPVDIPALLEFGTTPQAGAVVLFQGIVREMTQGRRTVALEYEAFAEMALSKIDELIEEARSRWNLSKVAVEHRLGRLALTECSVAIVVSSPHRKEAFEAGQFLIDELKVSVPIWKKEHWDDGTTEWVHPGLNLI